MEDSWELWISKLDDNSINPFVNIEKNLRNSTEQPTLLSTVTDSQSLWPSLAGNINIEARINEGTKRRRSSLEAKDHRVSERKRRQEMTERFIALSAIIPGLKKIDKVSVVGEAIKYVKHLQERIAVMEGKSSKKKDSTKSMMIFTSPPRDETNYNTTQMPLQVEAIGLELEKEVLIRIHCQKRIGIFPKLLLLLQTIHLSIARSSILPFGNNTLIITIVTQMGDKYSMTVNELVKNLKHDLMKLYDMQM